MKKTLSILLALLMLVCAFPMTVYAATPTATNLKVTNAVAGKVTGSTVSFSWDRTGDNPSYSYEVDITKSYDGTNYNEAARKTSNVGTNTYTYNCVEADYNKTVYFGVQYEYSGSSSLHNSDKRATTSVYIEKKAGIDTEQCKELMLQGLADPTFRKTTDNYKDNKFVVGTKAIWDCKLYTLTAKATKVSGKKVTFNIKFSSKLPDEYIGEKGYSINIGTKTYYPEDTINYTVDTSKSDGLATSGMYGKQYFKIRIDRTQVIDPIIYSSNKYFVDIVKNREVYPENSNYISRVYLSDTYTLAYKLKPDFTIAKSNYKVTKSSISLGTYSFPSVVKYRKKGSSSWKSKTISKDSKMNISGLSSGTTYEIKPYYKSSSTDPETGKKSTSTDLIGNTITLTTTINKKPQLTSLKVSNIKYGTQTINGYWESDGDWHPTETFNTANYTITVKVKNVPSKAKGLRMKVGSSTYYAKGNKKTYTFKLTYRDKSKVKGKKFTANFAWASNTVSSAPVGIGPSKNVSYNIKAGTKKVK